MIEVVDGVANIADCTLELMEFARKERAGDKKKK